MNITKVRRLSEEYEMLKDFHEVCNRVDLVLIAKQAGTSFGEVTLNVTIVKTIIAPIRRILMDRRKVLAKEIKEEAAK